MAVERSFMLKLFADPKEVLNAFGKIRQSLDDTFSGAGKEGLDKLGANLTKMGLIGSAASAAVGGALFLMAKESDNANRETLKLSGAIANQDRLASGAQERFVALAKAIQQTTSADADAIVGAQALLVQFGLTESQIKTLTPLIVDLSVQTGVSLRDAALSVAKGVDGSAKSLKGLGINVDETALKTDGFAATVSALSSTVGGFAEKQGATFSGSLERLRNNLGDLREGIGSGAANVFQPLADGAGKAAGFLSRLDSVSNGAAGSIAAIGGIGLATASQLSLFAGQAIKLRDAFTTVTQVGDVTTRSFTNLGKGLAGAAGVAGVALFVYSQYAAKKQEVKQRTIELAEALKLEGDAQIKATGALILSDPVIKRQLETLVKLGLTTKDLADTVDGKEVPGIERLRDARLELNKQINSGILKVEAAIGPQGEVVTMTLSEAIATNNLIREIDRLVANRKLETDAANLAAGATEKVVVAKFKELTLEQIAAQARTNSVQGKYDDLRASNAGADALDAFTKSQGFVTAAVSAGTKATKEATKERLNGLIAIDLFKVGQDFLTVSQRKFDDATDDSESSTKDLTKAEKDLESVDKTLTAAKDKLATAMRGQGRSSDDAKKAARGIASAQRDLQRANNGVTDALSRQVEAEQTLQKLRALKADPRKVTDAEFDLEGAKIGVEEATLRVEKAEASLAKTLADPEASAIDKREAELDLVNAKRSLRSSILDVGDSEAELIAIRATGASAEELADAERALADAKLSVQDSIEAQTQAVEDLNEQNDKYRIITEGIREGDEEYIKLTKVVEEAFDARTKAADDLTTALNSSKTAAANLLKAFQDLEIGKTGLGGMGTLFTFPEGKAAGGPVKGGRPYVVGEMGPELFVPGGSGSIIPNGNLGGAGTKVEITVNSSIINPLQVAQEIQDYLDQLNRSYGTYRP